MYQSQYRRRDRLTLQKRDDALQPRQKLPEPTVCSQCHAVYSSGRWTWKDVPAQAHSVVCPACLRTQEDYPAGLIEMSGPFFEEHRQEMLNLVHNTEALEKKEHPLERIIKIHNEGPGTVVTTTGVHLARRIGEALHHAYQGDYELEYLEDERFVRVSFVR
jgi:NMD protein affecting ribosome stability and mRNA decay